MKNKHYDMIVAWAEGKQIQNFNENTGEWQDLIAPPYWIKNFQYRIKPEEKQPVVRWLWAIDKGNGFELHPRFVSDEKIPYPAMRYAAIRLDWSRTEFPE